jgi:hypothetical protein
VRRKITRKETKKAKKQKVKKNLTISKDNANAKANALLKDYRSIVRR